MSIEVTLNSLVFSIPSRGERSWDSLTDWCLEVNETLNNLGTSTNIPAGTATLVDGSPVSLYTINTPSTNSHIIFEYGIYRYYTSPTESLSVTGQLFLSYNALTATWVVTNQSNGNPEVTFDVSSNVLRATATTLGGTVQTNTIFYSGRIIKA